MTDSFEDHCWKDVGTPEVLEIYSRYQRETFGKPAERATEQGE
jgi:hypothetical protein